MKMTQGSNRMGVPLCTCSLTTLSPVKEYKTLEPIEERKKE